MPARQSGSQGQQWSNFCIFDWRGETSEVFMVRRAANLLAKILLLAANLLAAKVEMAWGGAFIRVGLNECLRGITEIMLGALDKI